MKSKLEKYYNEIKRKGLTKERNERILRELNDDQTHDVLKPFNPETESKESFYSDNDLNVLQDMSIFHHPYEMCLRSIDELLEKDKQREKDGFPRKIRVGRLVKPGKTGKDKIVVVPTTVEEKFIHDSIRSTDEESTSGGSGDGEEGEVIGEQPVHSDEGEGTGPGEGSAGQHEVESNAYDLGKILTEKFELPNLKNKGKKRAFTKYTYEMTDKNRGFGQLIDKKATLKKIIETNINLGNLPDVNNIDPTSFIISPKDKVYRVLSKEKDYESQAMVFFLRDYSGSMSGKPTELIVSQHVLIYSWLLYQYEKQVESRFIVHDTEAKEVPDFYTYYNSRVAGGTKVASAFKLVNDIVENESLNRDYNIYVFHGTDGDDWDTDGKESIPEIKRMLYYVNRIGITIAEQAYNHSYSSEVERYLKKSGLLIEQHEFIRLDVMQQDADEPRIIEGIKRLIS